MSLDLSGARAAFLVECRELLDAMEHGLLALEAEGAAALEEHVGGIFRAAHTIKGTAGAFGFETVVQFTHVVESLLDEVRALRVAVSSDVVSALFESLDTMRTLVDGLESSDDVVLSPQARALAVRLEGLMAGGKRGAAAHAADAAQGDVPVLTEVVQGGTPALQSGHWHLALRPDPACFVNGFDPLSLVSYLARLGTVESLALQADALPALAELDGERCYLGFDLALRSDASRAQIDEAFEFFREGSRIGMLPPGARLEDVAEFIAALDEAPQDCLDRLVALGTVTAGEREALLAAMADPQAAQADPAPASAPMDTAEVDAAPAARAAEPAARESGKESSGRAAAGGDRRVLRVAADRLDALVDLLGELVIANAGAANIASGLGHPRMNEAMEEVSGLVEAIRERALQLRMVQIGETFARFQRVVRDTARELGKEIKLEVVGGETELDKSVVERIGDPLLHLVRNAIDHGIGTAENRVKKGKPAAGTLTLTARHESGYVLIEVADDGKGLDTERIRMRAVERGLIRADAVMSEQDLQQLIFEPGFSTAEKVTDLSGRGVGMDVVKRNVQALRGTIRLYSKLGEGTRVQIRLPLTLAIIDGFVVGAGGSSFVLPLDVVVECIDLPPRTDVEGCLDLRGAVLPLLDLSHHFLLEPESVDRRSVVVVQIGEERAGIVVDRLLGERQAVIKPLGRVFDGMPGVGGSTLLGDGSIALVLDASSLLSEAERKHHTLRDSMRNTRSALETA